MSISRKLISWYQQKISPLFPARCKYYPTCSSYCSTAISRFGFFRGGLLGALRLLRCQPWVDGGIDDVPQKFSVFYRFPWSKAHEEPRISPLSISEHDVSSTTSTTHRSIQEITL